MATPPDFTAGQVLTAAQMNKIGMWLVKTQTVGTGVASVTVTDAFSADYDNYRVVWTGGNLSALTLLHTYMGAAPAANGYYGSRLTYGVTAGANSQVDNNATVWFWSSVGDTNFCTYDAHIYNPQKAKRTTIESIYVEPNGANSTFGKYIGYLDNNTQYTSFTLDPQGAATMTGGTIWVYGYNNG